MIFLRLSVRVRVRNAKMKGNQEHFRIFSLVIIAVKLFAFKT
jgi:hypothetical protein